MAQTLKYVIGKDHRPLTVLEAKGGNTFTPDYDKTNWVQARQYEDSLRQVFVEITNEDGSAYDLTGANVLFEGILPDNEHKILDNSHVVFYEDPTTGKFRFDMPAQAFSVAGQYKQAFFRVVKDYHNIAMLEFKFEVLADMVVTGMVARDYISPLEDLFNTIKETETKNVAELKKIIDDKINEITDLMTTLNQTNTATLSELNSAKTAVEALQDKIEQDGLFTQGEAKEFETKINNALQENKDSMNNVIDDLKKTPIDHKLKIKAISGTISPEKSISIETLKRVRSLGLSLTICQMVNLQDSKDDNPKVSDDEYSKLKSTLDAAKSVGVNVDMLKPHLGVSWNDSFNRATYNPTNIDMFFQKWNNILNKYAQICVDANIKILCVGCEMKELTVSKYSNYWLDLIHNLRSNYPNLKITYAFSGQEYSDYTQRITFMKTLDYVGINLYPGYISRTVTSDNPINWEEVNRGFYVDNSNVTNAWIIDKIHSLSGKNILITEIGIMPKSDGLINVISQRQDENDDFTATSILIKAALSGYLKDAPYIIGFAWWHLGSPFNIYDVNDGTNTRSVAENTMAEILKEGIV